MKANRKVCLWGLDQLALIVLYQSGVEYFNQVGGNSCVQKSVEGILTIIFDDLHEILEEISECTIGLMYLTDNDADKIDRVLSKFHTTCFLTVDREKLRESAEAWVYVNISYKENLKEYSQNFGEDEVYPQYDIKGFNETKGLLTWPNSD